MKNREEPKRWVRTWAPPIRQHADQARCVARPCVGPPGSLPGEKNGAPEGADSTPPGLRGLLLHREIGKLSLVRVDVDLSCDHHGSPDGKLDVGSGLWIPTFTRRLSGRVASMRVTMAPSGPTVSWGRPESGIGVG